MFPSVFTSCQKWSESLVGARDNRPSQAPSLSFLVKKNTQELFIIYKLLAAKESKSGSMDPECLGQVNCFMEERVRDFRGRTNSGWKLTDCVLCQVGVKGEIFESLLVEETKASGQVHGDSWSPLMSIPLRLSLEVFSKICHVNVSLRTKKRCKLHPEDQTQCVSLLMQ